MIFYLVGQGVCHFLLVINSRPNVGPICHRFLDTAIYSLRHSIENCVKPLQMETWLLLTAYWKLPAPYPLVGLYIPTTYHLATIPHYWHIMVHYDSSRLSKIIDFHVI